ncbi:uncharacterized protein LOC125795229 [Astyanax mexicanus]|uniref:uncharacterized protein LOC125795229 n=1 Tax=Astyanax mexicanus TaxID=7994 RepID=UPI0020CB0EE6|nr:uncharacterized protein LOC125795229 [Astyanax mexicanus]
MTKKAWVADLLREALNGLEEAEGASSVATSSNEAPSSNEENSPSCSRPCTSRAAQAAQNAVQGEVARAFAPYQSGTRKRRLVLPAANPKWRVQLQSFTHNFFCLRGRKDCSVPSAFEKVNLSTAGLGFKKIHFPDRACDAQEFQNQLTKSFPKLQEGGGFELLRTSGMTRSKTLEIIPCPESGYTPLYLTTEAGVGSSILYVRPLQANLSMERILVHLKK